MKRKRKVDTVHSLRADNYVWHFGARHFARAFPDRVLVARLVERLPRPRLGLFGQEVFDDMELGEWLMPVGYYELSNRFDIHPGRLLHWYWSDDGWHDFELLWQELPEAVDLSTPLWISTDFIHTHPQALAEFRRPNGTK
jgi:hypothetical protein